MTWSSNASWTKVKDSKDIHRGRDKSYAQAICERIEETYGPGNPPCETRGHCTKTWVEKEED